MLHILDNDVDIYDYADDNALVCSGYDRGGGGGGVLDPIMGK